MSRTIMKVSGSIYIMTVLLMGSHLIAAPFNLEDEGEDFVKDLLKAIPERADGLSSSKARKAIFKELQERKVFHANGDVRRKLEDREEVFSEKAIETVVEELTKVAREDKYAHFLLGKMQEKRLDDAEKVIVMREMAHHIEELKAVIKLEELKKLAVRKKPLTELITVYLDVTNRQKKTAQSLDELGLPEQLKVSQDGKPWVYYGQPGANFLIHKKKVIFIEPTPDENGKVLAVDVSKKTHLVTVDDVKKATLNYNKAQELEAKKVQELEAKKAEKAEKAKQSSKAHSEEKAIAAKAKEEQQRKLQADKKKQFTLAATKQLKGIEERLKTFKDRGPLPLTMSELKLPKDLLKANSADTKASQDWVYLEGKLNVKSNNQHRLLVIHPYDLGDGQYISLLSDGSIAFIKASQMEEIKSALAEL